MNYLHCLPRSSKADFNLKSLPSNYLIKVINTPFVHPLYIFCTSFVHYFFRFKNIIFYQFFIKL